MLGQPERSGSFFSYVSIEERILASHPLLRIRNLANQALDRLNPTFCQLYASEGRPSVPPEQLLLASLLQAFYGIRSVRLLLEQLNEDLVFRWFVGLSPDDPIWHPTTFTKNRELLLNEQVMGEFLEMLMGAPEVKPLLRNEHFSVDGTLLQPGPPTPRWSGSTARTIRRRLHQDLEKDSAQPRRGGSLPRVISAASSSATAPTAPAPIPMPCWPGNPMPIQRYPATGAMCSWTTSTT